MKRFVEWFGWYGTVAIVGAYLLLSMDIIGNGVLYQVLNISGAIGITWVSFAKGAKQPGVLNAIWTLIGVLALIRVLVG